MQEIDPALNEDKIFQEEMYKLNQLYEAKLASLQAAHEESRRKLIISAMIRNRKGLDVKVLMDQAAVRGQTERQSRDVYQQAAHNECFKVMLDTMSPNARQNEFDDALVESSNGGEGIMNEIEEEDVLLSPSSFNEVKSQDIFNRSSSVQSGNDEDVEESPPIAVSPTQTNGKHETVF
jgi:hypothetical protein